MGGGSDIPSATSNTQRYAEYIETRHEVMLANAFRYSDYVVNDSPYDAYTDIDITNAYFSTGLIISSFPSLYSMFGKYMSGFDVEVIWKDTFNKLLNQNEVSTLNEVSEIIEDNVIETKSVFSLSMRDINAVNSSSFIIGEAQIENKFITFLAEHSAEEKYSILALVNNDNIKTLNWNKDIITTYAVNMKSYFMASISSDNANYGIAVKNKLWSFIVLDFERAALATMKGGIGYRKIAPPRERSEVSQILYVASTTATGAAIGGPIGATIGFTIGLAQMLLE